MTLEYCAKAVLMLGALLSILKIARASARSGRSCEKNHTGAAKRSIARIVAVKNAMAIYLDRSEHLHAAMAVSNHHGGSVNRPLILLVTLRTSAQHGVIARISATSA